MSLPVPFQHTVYESVGLYGRLREDLLLPNANQALF